MNEYLPHDPDDDDRLHGTAYFEALAERQADEDAPENSGPERKRRRLVKPRKYLKGSPKRRDRRVTFHRFGGFTSIRCRLRLTPEDRSLIEAAANKWFQRCSNGHADYGAIASVLLHAVLQNLNDLRDETIDAAIMRLLPPRGVLGVDELSEDDRRRRNTPKSANGS